MNTIYFFLSKCKLNFNKVYSKILRKQFKSCGKRLSLTYPVFLKGEHYIMLGDDVSLDRNTRIEAWDNYQGMKYRPRVEIGNNVIFNPDCHIGCINKIKIGNNVLIGAGVLITDHSHGKTDAISLRKCPNKRALFSKGELIVNDNVWIAEHVAIIGKVTIGKNVIIGANAVVTKDIPDNAVVAGNPARVIKIIV